jgi:predicted nucleotide-binding protein
MAEPSALPIRTTVEDVISLTSYLATKPMGAYPSDAKAVLEEGVLDGRKVSAYKFWGLIEEAEGRFKLLDRGRTAGKNKGANIARAMLEVVKNTPAYAAIVERAIHRDEMSFTAVEVATHWHEHFRNVASSSERLLNDQAVCFFQVAQGAGLGTLILGRKGAPTRFEFSDEGKNKFADIAPMTSGSLVGTDAVDEEDDEEEANDGAVFTPPDATAAATAAGAFNNKVFITHGKNIKVLNQIKEIVSYGNYQPIIAQEHETIAKPVPDKVMDDMRACSAAVIHVSSEATYKNASGKERAKINDNVLIEIGAAMALYKRNFILVVEDGLELPSNLHGLYQCRYSGDELGMEATMKLLKAFKEFRE